MNINLEFYKIFYYVAKNKNITKTANELLISQPAISKSIKNLEKQLECNLFVRNKYGVILTKEGEYFYNQIKQAMELIENAEDKLNEMINLETGTLNIGINNTLTQNFLMPYIKEFRDKHQNIKIKIHTDPTYKLINKVRNGIIDFIILNLPYEIPNDFEKTVFKEIHDSFVASNKFSELKNKTIPLEKLNEYPLILLAPGSNTRYFIDDFCSKNNINLTPEIELASYSLVTEFTKAEMGIGLITKEFLEKDIKKGTVFEIKTIPELPSRNIGAIYLKNKSLSCSTKEFFKLIKGKISN